MRKLAIKLINWYQTKISPNTCPKCRFTPTCSQYAKECFMRFNFFKATMLTIWRLLRCNPFHKMAYDPVPEPKRIKKILDENGNKISNKNENSSEENH